MKRNAPKGYGWDGDIGTERSGCHRITQAAPHPLPDGVRPTGRAPWATGRRPPSAGTACSTRRRSATTATWRTATAATTGAGRRRTGGAPGTSGAGQGPPVVGAPAGPFPSAHHPRRMGSPAAAPRAPIWARATCPAKMALVPTSRTALRSACAVAGGPGSGQVSSIFGILRNGSELSPPLQRTPPAALVQTSCQTDVDMCDCAFCQAQCIEGVGPQYTCYTPSPTPTATATGSPTSATTLTVTPSPSSTVSHVPTTSPNTVPYLSSRTPTNSVGLHIWHCSRIQVHSTPWSKDQPCFRGVRSPEGPAHSPRWCENSQPAAFFQPVEFLSPGPLPIHELFIFQAAGQ